MTPQPFLGLKPGRRKPTCFGTNPIAFGWPRSVLTLFWLCDQRSGRNWAPAKEAVAHCLKAGVDAEGAKVPMPQPYSKQGAMRTTFGGYKVRPCRP